MIAPILMCLGVAMGAFGAHGLKDTLSPYGLAVYEKAVLYHFVHGLSLLIVPLYAASGALTKSRAQLVTLLFVFGILLFCGSLYVLAITEIKWLGAITPIGGTLFIVGWGVFVRSLMSGAKTEV